MTSKKLTVYIDSAVKQMLKDSAGTESLSQIVNEALESYLSAGLIRNLQPLKKEGEGAGFPSLAEVAKLRPAVKGSSADIIAKQRSGRGARISR